MVDFNTYVINLPEQKERFETQSKSLMDIGIFPVRMRASKYDEISQDELDRHFKPAAQTLMPRTNIACCYSHLKTLENFVNNDQNEVALILEDDAYPKIPHARALDDVLRKNGLAWDILSLHCDGLCPKATEEAKQHSGSAAAYFVTKEGAEKLLKHKWSDHFDMEGNEVPGIRKLVQDENLFWTDEDATMSGSVSSNRKKKWCPETLEELSKIFLKRGEKTACHILGYKRLRLPWAGYEMTNADIILLIILILSLAILL
jgi:hypothetical protein